MFPLTRVQFWHRFFEPQPSDGSVFVVGPPKKGGFPLGFPSEIRRGTLREPSNSTRPRIFGSVVFRTRSLPVSFPLRPLQKGVPSKNTHIHDLLDPGELEAHIVTFNSVVSSCEPCKRFLSAGWGKNRLTELDHRPLRLTWKLPEGPCKWSQVFQELCWPRW